MKERIYCVLDYETFSELPLRKYGSYEYSMHSSTDILCASWRIGTREFLPTAKTEFWAPLESTNWCGKSGFTSLFQALQSPEVMLVAHNALFEQVITRNVFAKKHMYSIPELQKIPVDRWICTAALSAALALPRKLEHVAKVLELKQQKDMSGNLLIKKWCRPRKPSKHNPDTRQSDPEEYERIVKYCMQDVDVETELFLKLPPLTAKERKIWKLDQQINLRGFKVDRPLVQTTLRLIAEESKELNRETKKLSEGKLSTALQRDGVLNFLEEQGVYLQNLQRKTIEDTLAEGLVEGKAKRLLEIRQGISKTSTAKYQALEMRSRSNSRLRDILVFHAASTGRWGGAGFQPQNLPRGTIKDTIVAAETIADGDLELVRLLYGNPMEVFSSCLRNMIVAPRGKTLDVGDYSAIEARVLFWVAKHEKGMQAFREKRDLYKELAVEIFKRDINKIDERQRFVGKQATLGCGYQMGAKKFGGTCRQLGQEVSEELAEAAVSAYRSKNKPVVDLWGYIQLAAMSAINNPKKKYTVNYTTWFVRDQFLWCQLPSGRRLAYFRPAIEYEKSQWGGKRPVLYHWGTDSKTKQWVRQATYGGKLVENVVQGIARDLMAEAMLRIEEKGPWRLVLSVHDELVAERRNGNSCLEKFLALMAEVPDWARGCPVAVEGWSGARYRK